jgi:hypothetical protein
MSCCPAIEIQWSSLSAWWLSGDISNYLSTTACADITVVVVIGSVVVVVIFVVVVVDLGSQSIAMP